MDQVTHAPAEGASGQSHAEYARYSTTAIVLHWSIAAILIGQIALGWMMGSSVGATRSWLLQAHKSIGFTILLLSLARLFWRAKHRPPEVAAHLSRVERLAATWTHRAFYVMLIGLPLTGWALVSAVGAADATRFFGLMPVPRIPVLPMLDGRVRDVVADIFSNAHVILVWVTLAMLALHIAGALKHHFVDRDHTLARMAPGARPGFVADPRVTAIFLGAIAAYASVNLLRPPLALASRPKPRTVEAADVYLDVVGPVLIRRCESCHNNDTARGGLSVSSYDAVMQGGDSGRDVVPGNPARSELLRRVTLASDHAQFMPKGGRPALTTDQVEAVRWWIKNGAHPGGKAGDLRLKLEDRQMLGGVLGLSSDSNSEADPSDRLPTVARADPAAVEALRTSGFVVRSAAANSNLLEVSRFARTQISAADAANLGKIGAQIRTLNLRAAGVTDDAMAAIGGMTNLDLLRLEENPGITDSGIARLGGLTSLRFVNLYGTGVSDRSLATIVALPHLQRVHIWNTKVTSAAADAAMARRQGLIVNSESIQKPSNIPVPPPLGG